MDECNVEESVKEAARQTSRHRCRETLQSLSRTPGQITRPHRRTSGKHLAETSCTAKQELPYACCLLALTRRLITNRRKGKDCGSHLQHRVGLQQAVLDGLHVLTGRTGHSVVLQDLLGRFRFSGSALTRDQDALILPLRSHGPVCVVCHGIAGGTMGDTGKFSRTFGSYGPQTFY